MNRATVATHALRRAVSTRRVRRIVQILALALFCVHVVATRNPLPAGFPAETLFRTDPLVALAASLAAREVAGWVLLALPLVVATLLLGRVFCGWLCPLGSLLDVFRFDSRARRIERPWLRGLSRLLLVVLLAGAAFGSLTLLALHPLALLLRALALGVLPALDHVLTISLTAAYGAGVLPDVALALDSLLRPAILPTLALDYRGGALALGLLAGVLALNLAAPRFWCRYLCPLGALLGVGARIAPFAFRVGAECNRCGHCVAQCKSAAISPKTLAVSASDCVACFDCLDECPQRAIRFSLRPKAPRLVDIPATSIPAGEGRTPRVQSVARASTPVVRDIGRTGGDYSPSRRRFLAGVGLGVAGVAVARVDASAAAPDPHAIRPPGAAADLASRCVRCGACIKVCPTAAVHPAGLETGLDGIWTPVLVARLGQCDWACNACGSVCPTGAIVPLALATKRQTIIGSAYIDQNRCLPWADARDCIVCQEMCPLPEKAIVLEEVTVKDAAGESRTVRRPIVDRTRCIGCGACENRCPLPGEAAIRVRATGIVITSARE